MQSALLTLSHLPVKPQLAHDAQNVHFPSGLQLLAANVGGNEAASSTNPCTGEEVVRVSWESGAPGRVREFRESGEYQRKWGIRP